MPRHFRYSRRHPRARAIQTAVWLIGLGILFLMRDFWPGILIVMGISWVIGALAREWEPPIEPREPAAPPPAPRPAPPVRPQVAARSAPTEPRLPAACPACGAPTRTPRTDRPADPFECAYCGSDLRPAAPR